MRVFGHRTRMITQFAYLPEQAAKSIRETPRGRDRRVAFYDEARGGPVKPDDWKPPDFRSLIKIAQTEQGRSEVSCVLEHVQALECRLMRMRKKQPKFRISCAAPLKATCGWPTWKRLRALPLQCPRTQKCPDNLIQMAQPQ